MKVLKHSAFSCAVKFDTDVAISFASCTENYSYFVHINDKDSGLEGWGEGAPFKLITGDSEEDAKKEYYSLPKTIPSCSTIEEFDDVWLSQIKSPTLKAAFDIAFHDLLAKRREIPVYKLFKERFTPVPNCVTVFIKPSHKETSEETSRIFKNFPHLQVLKIKLKGEDDVERCRVIKEASLCGIKYVLDANQGYKDPAKAGTDLNQILDILGDVILIEEPCPKGELEKLKKVRELVSHTVIVADESCCCEADLDKIASSNAAGGINVKLQKAGGIHAAQKLVSKAHSLGLMVMIGQMFESSLSTAASLAVGVTSSGVLITDLDMDLELPYFATGMCPFEGGRRYPVESPGFGFSLDSQAVTKLEKEGKIRMTTWD